jgi:hypothetical protein
MNSDLPHTDSQQAKKRRSAELIAVGVFVAFNLLAPFIVGEMYPITVSPMFCDQPSQYCTYELTDENGTALDLEPFGLHLVYDGNPPGLGMGIEAKPRMHSFGEVPGIDQVVEHVRSVATNSNMKHNYVLIRQTVVCCNGTCPESVTRTAEVHFSERAAK